MIGQNLLARAVTLALVWPLASVIGAQGYPERPVRIVTSEPGNTADINARLVAQGINKGLGQAVIVENRRGTIIAAETVAKAIADGYTLLALGSSFWIGPLMQQAPYDPVRDFTAITSTATAPNVLVVHPSLPVNTVSELIALAKAKPGVLNYSTGASGGSGHIAAELFKAMAGVNIVLIRYKGGGPALTGLLGGEVQLMFNSTSAVAPHVKSGKLRALGVTSAKPSMLAPGLPTIAASGLPGYESSSVQGVWAPSKTSPAIVRRLNAEIVAVLSRPEVRDQLLASGAEPAPLTPERFAADIKSDTVKIARLIKDAGIRAE